MRVFSVSVGLVFFVGVAAAQAPPAQPYGSLAQIMRGILFPNANILFDVQSNDPAAPKKAETGGGATATFSNIYTGWQVVENSALALAESATLINLPGRLCDNGRPVPIKQADWQKYSQELVVASRAMYKAAQSRKQDVASDATNDVAAACENCHTTYRDKGAGAPRCTP